MQLNERNPRKKITKFGTVISSDQQSQMVRIETHLLNLVFLFRIRCLYHLNSQNYKIHIN